MEISNPWRVPGQIPLGNATLRKRLRVRPNAEQRVVDKQNDHSANYCDQYAIEI